MKDLSGSNIMVTGSCGCIGSYIVDYLVENFDNLRIFCIDNFYNGKIENLDYALSIADSNKRNNLLLFYQIDINDILSVDFEHAMDYVFHQASTLTIDSKKDRVKAAETNVLGFTKICEFSLMNNAKLTFASSASVYGNPDVVPTAENYTFNNNRLMYGATKISGEYIANSYADEEGLKFAALRPFNVYGPRQSLSNVYTQVVPKFINSLLDGKEITIFGSGNQTMDMIHAKDVARFYVMLAQKTLYRGNEIHFVVPHEKIHADMWINFDGYINCGTGISTDVNELYDIILTTINSLPQYCEPYQANKKVRYEEHDPNLVSKRQADVKLLHKILGKHTTEVKQGIKEMVMETIKKRS